MTFPGRDSFLFALGPSKTRVSPGELERPPSIIRIGLALVAQWIEHQLAELGVGGSNPLERANFLIFGAHPVHEFMNDVELGNFSQRFHKRFFLTNVR